MAKVGALILLIALTATSGATAEKTNASPQCAKRPGLAGEAAVATADAARTIYLGVAKQRGDKAAPENDVIVDDDGDHWTVFQYPKHIPAPRTSSAGTDEITVVAGGGTLEMEIDKGTGAICTHYSR